MVWACLVSIATSVVSSIASTIMSPMVEPVRKWVCFPFEYDSNIEKLQNELEKLKEAGERMGNDINDASINGQEIEADVNRWLGKLDDTAKKAKELLDRAEKVMSRCSDRLNFKLRHQLSQEAEKTLQVIDELINDDVRKRDRVGHRPPSDVIVTSTNYLNFESRQPIKVDLMEALKDTNIHMIGVWGMGGIGKTTLVTEVSGQAKGENLFSEVAIANVGENPDIRRIQGEIADMIRLKLEGETEVGRAGNLEQRLINNTKTLVVLDNIWKTLDLKKIGIPCKGCKVVLISRNGEVLRQLDTEKDFELTPLPPKEAWNLVVKMAGNSVEGSDFREITTKIVDKCAGLPIALVAVFKALKGKRSEEWEDAFRRLGRPASRSFTEMQWTIHSCIKLSYDHLENQEVKDCFLQCAQMPYPNLHEDLLIVCYGLDLFPRVRTLAEARKDVDVLVRSLKDSGLLQDCSPMLDCPQRSEHHHIHDIVREAGRLIALEEHKMIVLGDDAIKEWSAKDIPKRCKALSIHGGDIQKFCNETEFPELELLCGTGKCMSLQVRDTLFRGMEKLRVLGFNGVWLSFLSSPVILPTNLVTLKLEDCLLYDVALIGELKNLRILILNRSNLSELPIDISSLTHLQLLDLSNNYALEVIPANVLSSLVELEEFYMTNTSIEWKLEGVYNETESTRLIELKNLQQLVTLEIDITNASYLPNDLSFPEYKSYKILVGGPIYWSKMYQTSRSLALRNISSFQSKKTFANLLKVVESLFLDNLEGVNSTLHELDMEGFQHLKHLRIQNSSKIKNVINSKIKNVINSKMPFHILEILVLDRMINLEEIYRGQPSSACFNTLRVVKIHTCERLKYFMSLSIASGFSKLEKLVIINCSNMAAIVVKEGGRTEERPMTLFPKLYCLKLRRLPKLKSFLGLQNSFTTDGGGIISEGKLDCSMHILHGEVLLPMLKELDLYMIGNSEDIQHKQRRSESSCKITSMPTTSNFQNLSDLRVEALGNIKHLLSFSTAKLMVKLESLWIGRCGALETILLTEDLGVEEEIILFPRLKKLSLKDLRALKIFCMGRNINFSSLKELKIKDCPGMKTFICKPIHLDMTASKNFKEICAGDGSHIIIEPLFNEVVSFPNLEELKIYKMVELKIISGSQFTIDSFCKLKYMRIISCENLKSIFQSNMLARFQNLEELFVKDCDSLEQVFEIQGLNVEEIHVVAAIQLKTLSLECLPKLRHVWNKDLAPFFMQVETLIIDTCGVEEIFEREEVAHEIQAQLSSKTLDKLGVVEMKEILVMDNLEMQEELIFFPQLKELFLKDLPLKRFCIGSNIKFPSLRKLEVDHCLRMKTFIGKLVNSGMGTSEKHIGMSLEDGSHTSTEPFFSKVDAFHNLETLEICNVVELKIIWPSHFPTDSCQFLSFQNLQKVEVNNCQSLKSLFPASAARYLTQLEILVITNCGVEEIVAREEVEQPTDQIVFPQLKFLHLADLPRLKQFLPGVHASRDEGSIEEVHFLFDKVVFPNLQNLEICNLVELKILWPSHFPIVSFHKLWMISIESCGNLTSIFQCNMLERCLHVENLYVTNCDSLEQVFELQGLDVEKRHTKTVIQLQILVICDLPKLRHVWNKGSCQFFSFQNLQQVEANNCQSLKSLFPTSAARQLTQLVNLVITKCGVEEIVAREEAEQPTDQIIFPQVKFLHLADLPRLKQFLPHVHASRDEGSIEEVHFLFDKVAFPNLENLKICNVVELKIIWPSHFPVDSFCKLRKMHIESCENLTSIFHSNMLERFQNLEELCVKDCGSLEQVVDLQGLNVEERQIEIAIQLKILTMCHLPKLRHLWNKDPSGFFSFQNRQLTKLNNLNITNCGLEEIVVGNEEGQAMNWLIFPQVRHLILEDLPRLKQFHPGLHTSEWPKLNSIRVERCPFVWVPKRKEGKLEQCQPEACDKHVHFLFDTVRALTNFTKHVSGSSRNNIAHKWNKLIFYAIP